MPSICEFILNKENGTYIVGETISGTIILHTTNDKTVKKIYVGFKGACNVTYLDTAATRRRNGLSRNGGEFLTRQHFATLKHLVHREGILKAGTYRWNFRFTVNASSFTLMNQRNDQVNYHVFLKIKNETTYNNVFEKPVTVIEGTELNHNTPFSLFS